MVVINNVRQQNEDRVSYLIKLDARNVYEISHPANRAITQKSTCDTVYVTGGGGVCNYLKAFVRKRQLRNAFTIFFANSRTPANVGTTQGLVQIRSIMIYDRRWKKVTRELMTGTVRSTKATRKPFLFHEINSKLSTAIYATTFLTFSSQL